MHPTSEPSSYKLPSSTETPVDVLERNLEIRNQIQIDLAEKMGIDLLSFIKMYGKRFGDFVSENPSILDEYTKNQDEALQQVGEKIFH